MPQTFKIKKGEINFFENKICISDNAKEKKRKSVNIFVFIGFLNVNTLLVKIKIECLFIFVNRTEKSNYDKRICNKIVSRPEGKGCLG